MPSATLGDVVRVDSSERIPIGLVACKACGLVSSVGNTNPVPASAVGARLCSDCWSAIVRIRRYWTSAPAPFRTAFDSYAATLGPVPTSDDG